MRIGICFFIDSNLGGAATQADDLVNVARRLGHDACLLRFTSSPRSRDLYTYGDELPSHKLLIGKTGIRFQSEKLLANGPRAKKFMKTFDVLIFVGGCPHITRTFEESEFHQDYQWLYSLPCKKYIFLTDPFWQKLYPYLKDVIGEMDGVYAFAEAYKNIVEKSGLCDNISICNFGSIASSEKAATVSLKNRKNCILWPHQWRSWKNPDLLISIGHLLKTPVNAYSDGIEWHKIRRDRWEDYRKSVCCDNIKQDCNGKGAITYHGTVPQKTIMDEFSRCKWMLDFTGMSARTGKPIPKFVGNYQCVNIEAMMLGCVTFKFENTIRPHSQIPKDCVIPLPLDTRPLPLVNLVNRECAAADYQQIAQRARDWSIDRFDPFKVFEKSFLS